MVELPFDPLRRAEEVERLIISQSVIHSNSAKLDTVRLVKIEKKL